MDSVAGLLAEENVRRYAELIERLPKPPRPRPALMKRVTNSASPLRPPPTARIAITPISPEPATIRGSLTSGRLSPQGAA